MKVQLPPDEYYASLARIPSSGGAIIRNEAGEFLIVRLAYKEPWHIQGDWHISGGMTELSESPRDAVIREVKEELGINVPQANLFCIDFAKKPPYDRMLFVFDCGVLDNKTISLMKPDTDEISEVRFVPKEEMFTLLSPKIKKRLESSIEALLNGTCVYLENGEKVK